MPVIWINWDNIFFGSDGLNFADDHFVEFLLELKACLDVSDTLFLFHDSWPNELLKLMCERGVNFDQFIVNGKGFSLR